MNLADHYAALGVLPDAEDVVIVAAYRALAQRYHPDKWPGDPAEAHERMARINEAYRILSDPQLRKRFDEQRRPFRQEFDSSEQTEQGCAFDQAWEMLEDRWEVATRVFPDLQDTRARLARISHSLAFTFAVGLLETKAFSQRQEVAERLERNFLERYFGSDERIIEYAKALIFGGHRLAAKSLNNLVEVLGSQVDPQLLITRIEEDFGFKEARAKQAVHAAERARLKELASVVRNMGYYREAKILAHELGYEVRESGGGFFKDAEVHVSGPAIGSSTELSFKNSVRFVHWVQINLARPLLSAA